MGSASNKFWCYFKKYILFSQSRILVADMFPNSQRLPIEGGLIKDMDALSHGLKAPNGLRRHVWAMMNVSTFYLKYIAFMNRNIAA